MGTPTWSTSKALRLACLASLVVATCGWWPGKPQDASQAWLWQIATVLVTLAWVARRAPGARSSWVLVVCAAALGNVAWHRFTADLGAVMTLLLATLWYDAWRVSIPAAQTIRAVVLVAIANSVVSVLQWLKCDWWFGGAGGLPHGWLPLSPIASACYALALPLAWSWRRWLVAPLLIGVALARSWTGYLGLLTWLALLAWRMRARWAWLATWVVATLAILWMGSDQWWSRLTFRWTWWAESLDTWTGYALFGIGLNRFPAAAASLLPQFAVDGQPGWTFLHSEPVRLLLETGMTGAFAVWYAMTRWWPRWRVFRPEVATALLLLAVMATMQDLFHYASTGVIALALIATGERQEGDEDA